MTDSSHAEPQTLESQADSQATPDNEKSMFDTSVTFRDLGLSDPVLAGIDKKGFVHPTDIQARLIPAILNGKDVMGQARTGTGKSAAFGLPVLEKADPELPQQALVLAPTRELAVQLAAELDALASGTPINAVCIVGGESMRAQKKKLERGAQIIVGTPGRVMDLKSQGEISFDNIRFAVLDEVDRMLDIGFRDDIRKVLKAIKSEHQTVFVSATISPEIERLARSFMKDDAEKITVVQGSLTVAMVDQKYLSVEPWDKRALLLKILKTEQPDTTVVFCKTKATVRKVTQYLRDKGLEAREIHGDLHQNKRNRVMKSMRGGSVDILVASDLAARGLDVDHITHVINYDIPEDPEVYIHRIGRTARAGRRGVAWSFVTPEEGQRLTDIEKLASAHIEHMEYPDFKPGPVPRDVQDDRDRATRREEIAAQNKSRTGVETDTLSDEEKAKLFPGGIIPKGPPPQSLGSRFRRRGR